MIRTDNHKGARDPLGSPRNILMVALMCIFSLASCKTFCMGTHGPIVGSYQTAKQAIRDSVEAYKDLVISAIRELKPASPLSVIGHMAGSYTHYPKSIDKEGWRAN